MPILEQIWDVWQRNEQREEAYTKHIFNRWATKAIASHLRHSSSAQSTDVDKEYEPVHEIPNNMLCATSKASDQPAHMRSLIGAFASRLSSLWLLSYWPTTIWSF